MRQDDSVSNSSEDETTKELQVTRYGASDNNEKEYYRQRSTTRHSHETKTTPNAVVILGEMAPNPSSSAIVNLIKINIDEPTTPTTTQKVYTEKYIKGIYQTPRLVREDIKVQDFIQDIQEKSKIFFNSMKDKVPDVRSKNKIDFLSRSYDEKFNEFLNETQNQKILTRLGTQKVILNIIDTSNGIMKRLLNYLLGDMQNKGTLRHGAITILEGELINEEKQDYLNACKKFGVCRTKDRFSLYAAEFLTEIISGDDDKIKRAVDCFTELFKDADYSSIVDKKLKKQIVATMEWIDEIEGRELRPLLMSFKNMLVSKNRPLVVMPDAYGSAMNRSVAFLDLVDAIDEKLPPTGGAVKEWNECIGDAREWVAGLRNDALDIMSKFSAQFLIKAARRMKGKMLKKVTQNLKILFKPEAVEL